MSAKDNHLAGMYAKVEKFSLNLDKLPQQALFSQDMKDDLSQMLKIIRNCESIETMRSINRNLRTLSVLAQAMTSLGFSNAPEPKSRFKNNTEPDLDQSMMAI